MTLHTGDRHVFGSVLDPSGSELILLSWIRIRIQIGNADPDSEPRARKLTKISNSTWFPAFQNGFCIYVLWHNTYTKYIFHVKIYLFVMAKSDRIWIRIHIDPHWWGSLDLDPHWGIKLDLDPHWNQCGSEHWSYLPNSSWLSKAAITGIGTLIKLTWVFSLSL